MSNGQGLCTVLRSPWHSRAKTLEIKTVEMHSPYVLCFIVSSTVKLTFSQYI